MNDTHLNSQPEQDLPTAALLRCAADGELTPSQQAALDAHLQAHPEDAARIRFERDLRQACARAMAGQDVTAPADLRARIAALTARPAAPVPQPAAEPEVVVVAGRIGPARLQRWASLAAAVLLLGAGAALLVRGGMLTRGAPGDTASAAVVLTNFLSQEHKRCSAGREGSFAQRLRVTDLSRVPEAVQQVLGKPVSVESMAEADFQFIGAGSCRVPGAEKSVHLLFRRMCDGQPSGPPVSLFIEPDTGRLNLEEGVTYAVEEGGRDAPRVIAWTHDGLVYYLVTSCSVTCESARHRLDAPPSLAGLAR